MVQGKATEVDNALLQRSDGATTLLTAIEGNKKAWSKVKEAAGRELRSEVPMQNTEYGVRNSMIPPTQQAGEAMWVQGEAAMELDESVRNTIENFAKRAGSTVIVEHGLVDEDGEAIMGEEKDGVIKINADYADVAHSIAIHEFTHRMQNIAPKASEKFRNYVVAKMKNEGTYERAMEKLREDYQGLSDKKLLDELCAETAERLFDNEAELTDFIKKDRTMAERVKDVWLKVLDMLGRTDEKIHAQLLWKKCVKEATKGKDNYVKSSEIRYKKAESGVKSVEERIFGVEKTVTQRFSNSLDEFQNNKNKLETLLKISSRTPKIISEIQNISDKLREKISICKTPFVLRCIGADDLNISIASSVINKATGEIDEAHSISIDSLKSLPSELADPIMVFASESNKVRKQRSLVVLTSITNQKGHEAIVILQLNKNEGFAEINDIASVYSKTDKMGRNKIDDFIKKQIENGNLKYINKEKSDRWLRTSRLQLPTVNTIIASDNNILQKEDIVNRYNMQNGENNSTSVYKRPGVSEKLNEYTGFEGSASSEFAEANPPSPAGESVDASQLARENAELRAQLENMSLYRVSKSAQYGAEVRRAALDLKSGYGSKINVSTLQKDLGELYNYMVGRDTSNDGEVSKKIHSLAEKVIAQATETVETEEYSDLLDRIKTTRILVPESERTGFRDGYEYFRKHTAMGKITLANEGIELDVLWEELCNEYPQFFDENMTGSEERLERILEVREEIGPTEESIYHTNEEYRSAVLAEKMFRKNFQNNLLADREVSDNISPSERFNTKKTDIRYSRSGTRVSDLHNSSDSDIVKTDGSQNILNELLAEVPLTRVKMLEFPPYNKSYSEANQIATRWAHNESIQTGDQRIVAYHGNLYVIEKFDSLDMQYQITGRLSSSNYRKIVERMKEYAKLAEGQSTSGMVNDNGERSGTGSRLGRKGPGTDDTTTEHRGENKTVQAMVENKTSTRQTGSDSGRDNARNGTDRQTQSGVEESRKSVSGTRLSEIDSFGDNNSEQFRTMWTIEEGVLSNREVRQFYNKISEMTKQRYHNYHVSVDGEYVFEVENKLIYSNGDYDFPEITKVVTFNTDDENLIDYGRRCVYDSIEYGYQLGEALEISETLLGQGNAFATNFEDSRAFEREVRSRERHNDRENHKGTRKSVSGTRLSEIEGEEILRDAQNNTSQKFIKPGAEPRRDVKVPESVKEGTKVRRFARTTAEAETLTDETAEGVLEDVEQGKFNYIPISDKSAMKNAYASLDTMGVEWVEEKVKAINIIYKSRSRVKDILKFSIASLMGDTEQPMITENMARLEELFDLMRDAIFKNATGEMTPKELEKICYEVKTESEKLRKENEEHEMTRKILKRTCKKLKNVL